nr:tRNA lysidine(34) synthetase TilS [Aestuariivivens sediminicola]
MLMGFKNHIENRFPFLRNSKILIAISGGMDSVVLTHLCYKLRLNIALAHCNFNLRGEESEADESFVLDLAEDLELEVFVESFDTIDYAKKQKRSIQMAARELRYNWFKELASQLQFDYILTAHHADDNLETFLINFTRGTGLAGLTGIPEVKDVFVRPLLPFSRAALRDFAINNKIKWRDDSSNRSVKYLRNKLRHDVIPILKEVNPSLLQSFQMTLNNLNDAAFLVQDHINHFLETAVAYVDKDVIAYKVSEFKKLSHPSVYLFEILKTYGFSEWHDVTNLLDAETGKYVLSKTHRLLKNREHLLLSKLESKPYQAIAISDVEKEVDTPFGTLSFEVVDKISKSDSNTIFVDKDSLCFPLVLRRGREGDYFYPFGMNGKKKLSKFFKDEKFSLIEKENTWLLCSENDIVWIVGKRADNRFKVSKNTQNILKISLKN